MPLILGTNSIKDTGYDVDNSLRFESSSTDHLSRSKSSSETSTTIGTFSFWVKRCETGATTPIYSNEVEDGNNRGYFTYINTDNFYVNNSVSGQSDRVLSTTQKFRDLSAWSHFVVAFDTNQGTASNRVKIYHNGNQITAFGTAVYPNQNENLKILEGGQTNKELVGKIYGADNSRMYLAEFHHIDGQALTPTDFGEFDEDSGIWKPIEYDGTYGNNGFYLDFENSGSLGADVSGNGNNFTVNNLTSIDQSTDTCTNNFCTLNPLIIFGSNNSEFKEGNLVYDDNRGDWRASVGTFGVQSGKWYWEMKLGSGTFHQVGIVGTTSPTSSANLIDLSQVHGGYSFYNDNGNLIARTNGGTISGWDSGTVGTSASTGDILMVALDMDNKFLYFGKNGTWVKSGNPTSGSSGTGAINISSDFTTGIDALPGVSMYSGSDGSLNFGSPPYSISSGNSDGNGYGNFEYAVPSSYYSLCTKNLAEYG